MGSDLLSVTFRDAELGNNASHPFQSLTRRLERPVQSMDFRIGVVTRFTQSPRLLLLLFFVIAACILLISISIVHIITSP